MIVANYSEFRNDLKKYLDEVEENNETLILKRGSGEGTVTISMREYNSIMETLYITGSESNVKHLRKSIKQMHSGKKTSIKSTDLE